jgi:predicted transcriptional regulator of viral defense system
MSDSYVINERRELILERVKEFIYSNGGVVKMAQLKELGIDYRRILDFVEKGDLIRLKNGYYAVRISDFSEDELIARLFPDCVLTLESGLYAYGYLTRKPFGYKLAVDKNTSKSRFKLDYPQVTPLYTEPDSLQIGISEIRFGGATMKIYERERLICDCLKYEDKMERELFREGLFAYIGDARKDVAKLMEYARERRVVKKAQMMIGAWL